MKKFLLIVALIAGCGDEDQSRDAADCTAAGATQTTSVNLTDEAFSPVCVKVAKGAEVTFTNKDSMAHTVTTDSGQAESFDSGNMDQNATFKHVFATAGTIRAHCENHGGMHIAIVVE